MFVALAFAMLAAQQPEPDLDSLLSSARQQLSKGEFPEARASMDQAWKMAQTLPAEDARRYDALKAFVTVLTAVAGYEEAETYLNLAIHWRESVIGPDDPKITDELFQLAHLCRLRGDFHRALDILNRVMSSRIRAKGYESVEMADLLTLQALIYIEQEKPTEAVQSMRESLRLRGKLLGEEHPTLVPDLDRLGATLATLRRYSESETAFRRVLLLRESLLGKEDPDLLATLDGLGYALFGQKKYEEAETVYLRLLQLWIKSSGADHPMVAWSYDKLALLYQDEKAEEKRKAAAANANAIRALILVKGLLGEVTIELAAGHRPEAAALLKQAQQALLMKHERLEKIRKEVESLSKDLAAPSNPKKQ